MANNHLSDATRLPGKDEYPRHLLCEDVMAIHMCT